MSASKPVILSLILVKGRLFRILWTSHNKVVNNSLVMVLPPVWHWFKWTFDWFYEWFPTTTHLWTERGVKSHSISFIVRKFSTFVWSKMLNLSLRSVAALTKFVPLSDFIIFTWPLLEMKRRSERINVLVDKSPASSRWVALAAKQV